MNGQHHVDMKYSIPKPSSKIKPKSKIRDFVVMTAATAIMACGIYFFKFYKHITKSSEKSNISIRFL